MLQSSLIPYADVVALNYNYILDEKIGWAMRRWISYRESYLVVDEAHNLQRVCSNLNSERITLGTLRYASRELNEAHPAEDLNVSRGSSKIRKMLEEHTMGSLELHNRRGWRCK